MKKIIKMLREEVKWCEQNMSPKKDRYEMGFRGGLLQALALIKQSQKLSDK